MSDEEGISVAARGSALARLLDAPAEPVIRHYRGRRARKSSLCGDRTGYHDSSLYNVTCTKCVSALAKRAA